MTHEELQAIKLMMIEVIDDKLEPIKQDIAELKQDVTGMKQDIADLKQDVTGMKQDIADLKQDVTGMKQDIADLKQDVTGMKLYLENVIDKNICIIAENHSTLVKNLNAAIPRVSQELLYEVKVNYLEAEVKELKKAVKELQDKIA